MSSRKRTKFESEFLLEPGQSLQAYNQLKAKWDSKLRATGFRDIEHLDEAGRTSFYSTDSSLGRISAAYNQSAEEYYRRAGIFLHHFDFMSLRKHINPAMARYIWTHYAAGYSLREIVRTFKVAPDPTQAHIKHTKPYKPRLSTARPPLVRTYKGPVEGPPSVCYVRLRLINILLPAFEAFCQAETEGLLAVEWDNAPY